MLLLIAYMSCYNFQGLIPKGYSKKELPPTKGGDVLNVTLDILLEEILEVNDFENTLRASLVA